MQEPLQTAMVPLAFLIGRWHTQGEIRATRTNPAGKVIGTDSYEWILDGQFILHKVDVIMNQEKVETIEIIGNFDVQSQRYQMRSFDNSGVFTEMEAYLDDKGDFYILGDNMRSKLFKQGHNSITVHWESSPNHEHWVPWMDLTLSR